MCLALQKRQFNRDIDKFPATPTNPFTRKVIGVGLRLEVFNIDLRLEVLDRMQVWYKDKEFFDPLYQMHIRNRPCSYFKRILKLYSHSILSTFLLWLSSPPYIIPHQLKVL